MSSQLINFDYNAFRFLNGLAGGSKVFDVILVALAEYVIFLIIASLALYVLLGKKEQKRRIMVAIQALVAGFIGRAIVVSAIRIFFFRPRPFVDAAVTQLIAHNPKEASFPSGHTSVMFAIAFVLLMFNVRWGVAYLVIALISAIARVVVGVHFPLDIIGGILVGLLSAIVVKLIFDICEKRVPGKKSRSKSKRR